MKVIKVVIIFTILMLPTKGYTTEESIQVSCELLYMRLMCSNIITQFLWSDLEPHFILIKKSYYLAQLLHTFLLGKSC